MAIVNCGRRQNRCRFEF